MNKKSEITISYCQRSDCGFGGVMLVRGLGKRAVLVFIRPFHISAAAERLLTDNELAIKAAEFAAKKGWKRIFVQQALFDDKQAIVSNPAWFLSYPDSQNGAYLCDYASKSRSFSEITDCFYL